MKIPTLCNIKIFNTQYQFVVKTNFSKRLAIEINCDKNRGINVDFRQKSFGEENGKENGIFRGICVRQVR